MRIAEDISLLEDKPEGLLEEDDENDENDREPMRYYKSHRVLGQLFRQIDERAFLEELKASTRRNQPRADLLQGIWAYVNAETAGFQWDHHISAGLSVKELYDKIPFLPVQFSRPSFNRLYILGMRITSAISWPSILQRLGKLRSLSMKFSSGISWGTARSRLSARKRIRKP